MIQSTSTTASAAVAVICLLLATLGNAFVVQTPTRIAPISKLHPHSIVSPPSLLSQQRNFHTSTSISLSAASIATTGNGDDESCDPYDPETSEYCTLKPEEIDGGIQRTIRLGVLFTLWYILNIGYNIGKKQTVLNL